MMPEGFWFAFGAYALWGLLPIFWKLLQAVPSFQILLHRMVWSLGFLLLILLIQNDWRWLRPLLKERKTLLIYLLAACLLAVNWGIYIWAVNAGFIVETSLGYFISPLVSVCVGVVVFKESLRKGQWLAVLVAAIGVVFLTLVYGRLPWIALSLAVSWNLYASVKKFAPLTSLRGLTLETAILFPPALATLLYLQNAGAGSFRQLGVDRDLLLVASGVVTALPLIFFTAAAKRLPLSTLGIMQYLAPTLQLGVGIFIYHEYFDVSRLVGFGIIWASLVVFTLEGLRYRRRRVGLAAS